MYYRVIILCMLVFFSTAYAKADKKLYTIEKGRIVYEIRGSTQFSSETNLTIQGKVTLHFKDWGSTSVEEENGVLLMNGAVEHREEVKNLIKYSENKVITVDYKNEQLIEGKLTSKHKHDITIENFELIGKKIIAGLECDIWKSRNIEKCLYKGIVLRIESKIYNAHYVKEATSIALDENMTDNNFILPDYPIHEIGLLNEYQSLKKVDSFTQFVKKKYSTEENKTNFLIHLGEDIFNQQKKLLPQLLLLMKKTRESLQSAEKPFENNSSIESFSEMNMYNSKQKEEYTLLWDEKNKDNLLNRLEDDLLSLESKIPCIKRAKNILDLSVCMKNK